MGVRNSSRIVGILGAVFSFLVLLVAVFRDKLSVGVNEMSHSSCETLKVHFPANSSVKAYDPAHILWHLEYGLLENIYSPLVEYTPEGDLVSAVAERFEWVGDEAHFTIRDYTTIDGIKITADDAAFSIKRLLARSKNTHGNLREILCPGTSIMNPHEPCPGVEVRGNVLVLKPVQKRIFLFPMLAAIDFSIIPRSSIDPKTFEIVDYRNTSGPYYVESDDENGALELRVNKFHWHHSKDIPQHVKLVPRPSIEERSIQSYPLEQFRRSEVDFVPSFGEVWSFDFVNFAKDSPAIVNLHSTLSINLTLLVFTEKGRKVPPERRFGLGRIMRELYLKRYLGKGDGREPTLEMLPVFGEGGLSDSEKTNLSLRYRSAPADDGTGLVFKVQHSTHKRVWQEDMKQVLPGLKIFTTEEIEESKKNGKPIEPDLYQVVTDTGFNEDIGLISYSMNRGYYPLSGVERTEWLRRYMATESKLERIEALQKLHFDSLAEPVVVPLSKKPYYALVRKPWTLQFSQFYAHNLLWMIKCSS